MCVDRGEAFLSKLQQETHLNNCFLLIPQLPSTYGPQTLSDMWSLPRDVTIATDPLGLEDCFFFLLPLSLPLSAQWCWSGRSGPALLGWFGGRDSISLINILYGPPGLWR